MKRVFFSLALFCSLALAETPDEILGRSPTARQEVERLTQTPSAIHAAMADGRTHADVRLYFRTLYGSPDYLRDYLGDLTRPIPFRLHILNRIVLWQKQGRFPNADVRPQDYVLAFLGAIRDTNPDPYFRETAYRIFSRDLFPALGEEGRRSVLNSLRQYARQAEREEWALPGLILVDSVDNIVPRLKALRGNENAAVRRRAMEALAYHSAATAKALDSRVQDVVVDFLRDPDERVRRLTSNVLALPRESVRTEGNRLRAGPTEELVRLLTDEPLPQEAEYAVSTRSLVITVLGRNWEVNFFDPSARLEIQPGLKRIAHFLLHGAEEEKAAAAGAFARIMPSDEDSQLALVECGFEVTPLALAQKCFEALGVRHKHRGDHRVTSEKVKAKIVEKLSALFDAQGRFHSTGHHWLERYGALLEDGAEVIARNIPRSADVYVAIVVLVMRELPQNIAAERTMRLKLISALSGVKSFPEPTENAALAGLLATLLAAANTSEASPLVEKGLSYIQPDAAALWGAFQSTDATGRRRIAKLLSQLSQEAFRRLAAETSGDELLAAAISSDDPEVCVPVLRAIWNTDVRLSSHPRTLERLFANVSNVGNGDITSLSLQVVRRIATTGRRYSWLGEHTPMLQQLIALAESDAQGAADARNLLSRCNYEVVNAWRDRQQQAD